MKQPAESTTKANSPRQLVCKLCKSKIAKTGFALCALALYQLAGAALFYFCETSFDDEQSAARLNSSEIVVFGQTQMKAVEKLLQRLKAALQQPSASKTVLTDWKLFTTEEVRLLRDSLMSSNEFRSISPSEEHHDNKSPWTFWDAMLYAQSVYTTIGYGGRLHPSTTAGRAGTVVYAIFGIPLLLTVLDDLGQIITRALKIPWFLLKMFARRLFRRRLRLAPKDLVRMEIADRRYLRSGELSLAAVLIAMGGWICVCSTALCLLEQTGEYLKAAYFVFTSISTIGLAEVTPSGPGHFIVLSMCLLIGLSLVSISVNQIQFKFHRRTPAKQHQQATTSDGLNDAQNSNEFSSSIRRPKLVSLERNTSSGSSLGVIRAQSSVKRRPQSQSQESFKQHKCSSKTRERQNRCSQTLLSFPCPGEGVKLRATVAHQSNVKILPRSLSIDDVMKLVDSEEGDILLLTDINRMTREELSGISETSRTSTTSEWFESGSSASDNMSTLYDSSSESAAALVLVSRSLSSDEFGQDQTHQVPTLFPQASLAFPHNYLSTLIQNARAAANSRNHSALLYERPKTLTDLELLEELEDRMLLTCSGAPFRIAANSLVQFRSRLSLIPEQNTIDDNDDEEGSGEVTNSSDGPCSSSLISITSHSQLIDEEQEPCSRSNKCLLPHKKANEKTVPQSKLDCNMNAE